MSEQNARDTQFQNFAKLLYESLYDQFSNLFVEEDDGDMEKAKQTNKGIQETIARRVYDLVEYACVNINNEQVKQIRMSLHPNAMIRAIPDMTELPKDRDG